MEVLGFDVAGWLVCLVVLLATVLIYSSRRFGMFKEQGIPGPTPYPLVGTMLSYFKKGIRDTDTYNARKYGKVVGTFEGGTPVLLVSDLDMMKQILVKDFNNFRNRRQSSSGYPMRSTVIALNDDHWKYVRNTISPSFTGGKLKAMASNLNRCAKDFVGHMENKAQKNESINLKEHATSYVLDAIASTAFGLQMDSQKDENNPFIHYSKKIFTFSMFNLYILLALFVPFLGKYIDKLNISSFDKETVNFFADILDRTIKERKEMNMNQSDFLQLMLNAEKEETSEAGSEENMQLNKDSAFAKRKGLTKKKKVPTATLR